MFDIKRQYKYPLLILFLFVLMQITTTASTEYDIVFLREDKNGIDQIYTLDIDNPNAKAKALTNNELGITIGHMVITSDSEQVIYLENTLATGSARVMQVNPMNGVQNILFDCAGGDSDTCLDIQINPIRSHLAIIAEANNECNEIIYLLNLTESDAEPLNIGCNSINIGFISNTEILFDRDDEGNLLVYNIETGDMEERRQEDYPTESYDLYIIGRNNSGYYIRNYETGDLWYFFDQPATITYSAWNDDETAFIFIAKQDQDDSEGELWIYDMESDETTALNEVGSSVRWLN